MKIRPVTIVTDSPSVLNQSTPVSRARRSPKSPSLFSSSDDDDRAEQRARPGAQAADERHQDHLARHGPVHVGQRLEAEHQRLERPGQARSAADSTKASSL